MKLKQFLLEYTTPSLDAQSLGDFIQTNCKEFLQSPLLKQYKMRNFLYRGMSSQSDVLLKYTHPNRKPKDMPEERHELFDAWMLKKFKHRYRSNAAFCSNNRGQAEDYGTAYIIIPIGPFDFVTSEIVTDAYEDLYETPGKRLMGRLSEDDKLQALQDILRIIGNGIPDKKLQTFYENSAPADVSFLLRFLISDILNSSSEILRVIRMNVKIAQKEVEIISQNLMSQLTRDKVIERVFEIANYKENDYKMLKIGNEVMLKCKAYLAINYDNRSSLKGVIDQLEKHQ